MFANIQDIGRNIYRNLRRLRVNREFLIFLVFLVVAIVFWFLQTFKETTTASLNFRLNITGIPKNVIITSDVPDRVTVTVSGRGFSILDYITKTDHRDVSIDYSSMQNQDGVLTVDNAAWKKIFSQVLSRSLKLTSINPSILEIYYSTGDHKYVPVIFGGTAKVDRQHVLCGIEMNPTYVDVYAPAAQFDTITSIYTEASHFNNLKDTTQVRLALRSPVGVKCIPDSVDATICVDLFTTKALKLPIFCENIPQDKVLRTFPMQATVSFRVSSSLYSQITEHDFALVVDYNSIKPGDKKCQLIMRSQPEGISNVKISPQSVDYIIEQE